MNFASKAVISETVRPFEKKRGEAPHVASLATNYLTIFIYLVSFFLNKLFFNIR